MSTWARELAAEVKAAAPNAPEPVYGLSEDGAVEGLSWFRDWKIVAHAQRGPGPETRHWYVHLYFDWFEPSQREIAHDLTPRDYFIRLVKEIWS